MPLVEPQYAWSTIITLEGPGKPGTTIRSHNKLP
jgi:hypothetical protein